VCKPPRKTNGDYDTVEDAVTEEIFNRHRGFMERNIGKLKQQFIILSSNYRHDGTYFDEILALCLALNNLHRKGKNREQEERRSNDEEAENESEQSGASSTEF